VLEDELEIEVEFISTGAKAVSDRTEIDASANRKVLKRNNKIYITKTKERGIVHSKGMNLIT
jgi:hypothetical protein